MIAEDIIKSETSEGIVLMVCPFCLHDIAATWQPLAAHTDELGRSKQPFSQQIVSEIPAEPGGAPVKRITASVQWLLCQNLECRQVVVQIVRIEQPFGPNIIPKHESWIALPKKKSIPVIDPLVPMSLKDD